MSEPKVDETKPSETKPKKMVSRNVAIALGIVCIMLIAGLGAAVDYYTITINNKDSTYNDYVSIHSYNNSEYTSLETYLQNYIMTHIRNNSEFDSELDKISILQGQVNDLNSTLNLEKSEVWVNNQTVSQSANSYNQWSFPAGYAGYIRVHIESTTTWLTTIEITYTAATLLSAPCGQTWTQLQNLSEVAFPVMPATIQIRVGNTNPVDNATETVTITYYY